MTHFPTGIAKFIPGGLYRAKLELDLFEEIDRNATVPPDEFLVFVAYADPGRIADTWYWPKKNRKIKIITPGFYVYEWFDLVEVPCDQETL